MQLDVTTSVISVCRNGVSRQVVDPLTFDASKLALLYGANGTSPLIMNLTAESKVFSQVQFPCIAEHQ
jgi:hypothetical protein